MDTRRIAMATLALDGATIEAVKALRVADVPSILLKGRSFAVWLYDAGEVRPYTDIDLLVPEARWDDAGRVLRGLGYAPSFAPRHDPPHASSYSRAVDLMHLDLHRSLQGLTAQSDDVWRALSQHTATLRLGGIDVTELDEVGRCLGVAVHAGRPDASGVRARADLDRAIAAAGEETWGAARELAEVLGGAEAFAAGLACTDSGQRLAAALGAGPVIGPDAAMPRGVNSLQRARAADSVGEGLGQLARWLVPTPALLRQTRPIARTGTAGMAVAYVTWPLWLIAQFVRAIAARS